MGVKRRLLRLASYYESKGEFARAGDLHARCGHHQAAVKSYLKVGGGSIDKAIEVVGKAQSDALTNMVVDYLMGETDGVAKDHNYLFRLHIALRNYEQAARTSVVIARQEQEMGNYKIAHTQLFDTFKARRAVSCIHSFTPSPRISTFLSPNFRLQLTVSALDPPVYFFGNLSPLLSDCIKNT